MASEKIICYTDGGFKKNPVMCSYGVYITPLSTIEEKSGMIQYGLIEYEKKTSQISEMWAIKVALETLLENNMAKNDVIVYSDSQYCVNTLNVWYNNWERKGLLDTKQNIELWKEIVSMKRMFKSITFKWLKGHEGLKDCDSIHNEYVDKLNQAAIGRLPVERARIWFEAAKW